MTEEKKIWFPVKRSGMGWGLPCCWQGWAVLLIYIALIVSARRVVEPAYYAAYILGLTAILIVICLFKGGRRGSPKA